VPHPSADHPVPELFGSNGRWRLWVLRWVRKMASRSSSNEARLRLSLSSPDLLMRAARHARYVAISSARVPD
jgi:hypothetical protein